ncbi:MAG: rhodanese-like domain-containing protein [Crocinitomicaceae bacterium]
MQEISPEKVAAAIENGSVFVDVREPFEIAEVAYDLPNQIQIPLGSIQERFSEIPKDKIIIVGCRSGGRSANACQFLMMQGYENVQNLQGGIMGWLDHGLPTK